MSKIFAKLDAVRRQKIYQQEAAKLEFAHQISSRMGEKEVSRAQLAYMIEHSPAYITKVLRGDNNLTIETMVELVHSLGGRLHFKVADLDQRVRWRGLVDGGSRARAATAETDDWTKPVHQVQRVRATRQVVTAEEQDHALVA